MQVLLLDEITVDLDVLGRADLMNFLVDECRERGATVIYATHIFDGLESWPTHLVSTCFQSSYHTAPPEEVECEQGCHMNVSVASPGITIRPRSVTPSCMQAYVARGRLQFVKPMRDIEELRTLSLMVGQSRWEGGKISTVNCGVIGRPDEEESMGNSACMGMVMEEVA